MMTDDTRSPGAAAPSARLLKLGKGACVLATLGAVAVFLYQGNVFRLWLAARADRRERERLVEAHHNQAITQDMARSRDVVEKFLEHVRAAHDDKAYALTSRDFQARVGLAEFRAMVERDAHVIGCPVRFLALDYNAMKRQTGEPYRYAAWIEEQKWLPFRITIVREEGEPRVDGWLLHED